MSGREGKGARAGCRKSPGKKGDCPSKNAESDGKDKASEVDEPTQRNTKSPSPTSPEAGKPEISSTDLESKDSKSAVGHMVPASEKGTEDNMLKDIGQDAKGKQNMEESTVDLKPVNPVTSKSEVKVEEGVKILSRTGDQGKNNIGKELELGSPETRTKPSFNSNNGSAKKRSSPDFTKQRSGNRYYGTRGGAVMLEKEKFLAMTVDEKRKYYGHKNYITLDKVEVWSKYYSQNEKQLKKMYPKEKEVLRALKDFPKIEVDEKLNAKVSLFEGDITSLEIDGIVNAANRLLLGGGGVDGAIHRAAGSQLLAECQSLNGCETGHAKTTCGYKLPAKYVIHTVGPQTTNCTELRNCYRNCFKEMAEHDMRSIAFCCISTGIYGFPNELAVHEALGSTREYLMKLKEGGRIDTIDRIIFCLFLRIDLDLYRSWIQVYFPTETKKDSNLNNKNNSATEISSDDSDSGKEEKEHRIDCNASESIDSSIVDSGEKNAAEEDMEEEVNPVKDHPHNAGSIENAVQPDKKSKMDPGVNCSQLNSDC